MGNVLLSIALQFEIIDVITCSEAGHQQSGCDTLGHFFDVYSFYKVSWKSDNKTSVPWSKFAMFLTSATGVLHTRDHADRAAL